MKNNIFLIIIAAIILLSIIMLARPQGILAGGEAYYHLLVSEKGIENSPTAVERPLFVSQYDYVLKAAFLFFNPVLFMKLFPIILGVICAILMFLVAKKIIKDKSALYASLIFVLSPTFLYIFSTNSAEIVQLSLLLAGAYLLVSKNKYLSCLSLVPFILASLNSIFISLLILVIYLTYFMIKKEKGYYFIACSIAIIALAVYNAPKFMINYSISNMTPLSNLFADFGGMLGISIFTAIFFIAGFIAMKKRECAYPMLIFLTVSFLINFRTIIYINIFVCAFAGIGLKNSIEKKWQLENLKQTMNFLMICGILFSSVSHINVLKSLGPSNDLIDAASWLGNNSDSSAIILSSPSNGFAIEYFSGRRVFIDPLFSSTEKFETLTNDSEEIYYSRTLEKTEKLLNEYCVNYILIDSKMTGGEVWKRPNDGLLFLLSNQEEFPTVYNKGGISIIYHESCN